MKFILKELENNSSTLPIQFKKILQARYSSHRVTNVISLINLFSNHKNIKNLAKETYNRVFRADAEEDIQEESSQDEISDEEFTDKECDPMFYRCFRGLTGNSRPGKS